MMSRKHFLLATLYHNICSEVMVEEPEARTQHFSAVVCGKLYIWGGGTRNTVSDIHARKRDNPSRVDIFDPNIEEWASVTTTGPPPPGLFSGACASYQQCLYTYGGNTRSLDTACLHQLDSRTHTWSQLSYALLSGGPVKKSGCKMVCVKGMLVLFGGSVNHGFTDELHTYDLKKGNNITYSCDRTVSGLDP